MRIGRPKIRCDEQAIFYETEVGFSGTARTLWFSVPREFGWMVSDRCDAALLALLICSMAQGEEIQADGVVSERLYYSLSACLQPILRSVIPTLHEVDIYAHEVERATSTGDAVATGFSAGVDSFCVLADHYYETPPPGFRLTHLLFNNVGSHGFGREGEQLFRRRLGRVRPVADRIGLPIVAVNSNLDQFYNDFGFQLTHTPRNASVGLLLQNGLGKFLYASSYRSTEVFVGPSDSIAYVDPITLPMLSTERTAALSVGSRYSRVEKTLRIAGIRDSHQALDVCLTGTTHGNCSACTKCMRTMITLHLAGYLGRYRNVFDFETYRNRLPDYAREILLSSHPTDREIAAFSKDRGVRLEALHLLASP